MPYTLNPEDKFGAKDTLAEGHPEKTILGVELDEEFNKIEGAFAIIDPGGDGSIDIDRVDGLQDALDTEKQERIQGDANLQGQIDSLENYDDAGIKADLATETQARIDGDAALQGQINGLEDYDDTQITADLATETQARIDGDAGLQSQIDGLDLGGAISEAPEDGNQYARQDAAWSIVQATDSANPVVISDDPPASPEEGDLWYSSKADDKGLYCWDGEVWFEVGDANGADGQDGQDGKDGVGGMLISSTEPPTKSDGMMWLDTSKPPAKVWIWDTSRWIEFPFSGSGAPINAREIADLQYLVVAGGGVGGVPYVDVYGGGGGAGGYRTNVPGDLSGGTGLAEGFYPTIPIGTTLQIVVGEGGQGTGDYSFTKAGNSALDNGGVVKKIESLAGGEAGINNVAPAVGGSGGGAWSYTACSTAAGTANQGYAGGGDNQSGYGAAGGGGSGGQGVRGSGSAGQNGGQGRVSTIDGLNLARAGGGGGSGSTGQGQGFAGAGNGYPTPGASEEKNAQPNSGSGGGGSKTVPGNGGSGVVIVRYLGDQAADGGDITAYNGYTIHTFNASGTFEVWSS
jgi:hypothetical protein